MNGDDTNDTNSCLQFKESHSCSGKVLNALAHPDPNRELPQKQQKPVKVYKVSVDRIEVK